jgi:hypothetical protein
MKTKLSDRVRPNVEVSEWVHTEIKELEYDLHELTLRLAASSGWVEDDDRATLRYTLQDIREFIESKVIYGKNVSSYEDGYKDALIEVLEYVETIMRKL